MKRKEKERKLDPKRNVKSYVSFSTTHVFVPDSDGFTASYAKDRSDP
jgi:hypothetical protein